MLDTGVRMTVAFRSAKVRTFAERKATHLEVIFTPVLLCSIGPIRSKLLHPSDKPTGVDQWTVRCH